MMPAASGVGSSPRTRGTSVTGRRSTRRSRFIPAHAGNIYSRPTHSLSAAVHPRARGEHGQPWAGVLWSPRFIPAHAGNISSTVGRTFVDAVHPRARGEHTKRAILAVANFGSSPRTRGTCYSRCISPKTWRFIPAHAGNIHPARSEFSLAAVHPRARGEH